MKEREINQRIEYYNLRLEKYGKTSKALGWFKGRQNIRYKILTSIGEFDNSSVLDVGCGFGDFKQYLENNFNNFEYVGLDINEKLLSIARENNPTGNFIEADIEKIEDKSFSFDWVISSGIFEYKTDDTYNFISRMLTKFYEIAKKGVSVDFLSDLVDFQSEEAFHADLEKIIKIAKLISPRFMIRHDYMRFEYTLYLYKNINKSERHVYLDFEENK